MTHEVHIFHHKAYGAFDFQISDDFVRPPPPKVIPRGIIDVEWSLPGRCMSDYCQNWLNKYCIGKWWYAIGLHNPNPNSHEYPEYTDTDSCYYTTFSRFRLDGLIVCFEKGSDAAFFKLKWGGS